VGRMETFIATMRGTIADEDASVGAKVKFMLVVRAKVGPTCTTKNSNEIIIGS
jgi:hypothetical protein